MSFDVAVTLRRGTWERRIAFTSGPGVTALVGPSGVGKTSTLDAIAGLLRPRAGHVTVGGVALFDSNGAIDHPPERRACGYVFQDYRLFPHLTVRANLQFGERLAPNKRRFLSLAEACAFLGLGELLDRKPSTLSGGEAQRVAIGRALLAGPRFLLMDEPLSAVDAPRRATIAEVIDRIRRDLALPVLLVTHSAEDVARLADTVITLD
ncbi:ATP-binding cassette domain-containing protein [Novosphingobium sp.]|uniref:ATP-binding cassette domain-containing protein n=1 Tax=Novosphingobium sp. TaxID=1874826 RepID=UPI0038BD7513